MRGILYLLPLCVFCLGWFARAAPSNPLLTDSTAARRVFSLASYRGPGTSGKLDRTSGDLARSSQFRSSHSPSVTPTPAPDETDVEDAPLAMSPEAFKVSADWQGFDDLRRGVKIFYPPGWLFFDGTQAATLQQEMAALGRAEIVNLLMSLPDRVRPSSLIGFGVAFPQDPPDLLHADNVVVEIFPSRDLSLYEFGQGAAAELGRRVGIDVDSFDLVTRLRPHREEAVSIRYRGAVPEPTTSQSILTGTRTAGWQVVLLSPDAEYLLVLTFSVRGEQFEELEPLLTEVVRRVQWADDHREAEPGVGPVLITNRTMYVHNEPASFSPVIGKIVAGKQFSIMERDFTGKWWRISYGGQPGWVSDRLVAANIPDAPLAVPVAMIDRRVNVRSGPGASNPVIRVAVPGQQFLITGRNAAGDWWQIDDNGRPGWVFDELVTPIDVEGVKVAVVKFPIPPLLPVTEPMMTVNRRMNVRGGPHGGYPIIGAALPGSQYLITGKNAAGDWWQIDEDGRPGWVYGDLVELVNAGSVQVVARFPLPPLLPATETVLTFSRRMNVYSGPGGRFPVIDTTVPGYQYPITGRNVVGTWWEIDNHGQPGWVFGQFVTAVEQVGEVR